MSNFVILLFLDQKKVTLMSSAARVPVTTKCPQASLAAFTLLFGEAVHFCGRRCERSGKEWEEELKGLGRNVGPRILELASAREKVPSRRTTAEGILFFVKDGIWETLFGRRAELEQVSGKAYEYFVVEDRSVLTRYIGDSGSPNVNYYTAGIIEGVMAAAGFDAQVSAFHVEEGRSYVTKFWVQIDEKVQQREMRLKAT